MTKPQLGKERNVRKKFFLHKQIGQRNCSPLPSHQWFPFLPPPPKKRGWVGGEIVWTIRVGKFKLYGGMGKMRGCLLKASLVSEASPPLSTSLSVSLPHSSSLLSLFLSYSHSHLLLLSPPPIPPPHSPLWLYPKKKETFFFFNLKAWRGNFFRMIRQSCKKIKPSYRFFFLPPTPLSLREF